MLRKRPADSNFISKYRSLACKFRMQQPILHTFQSIALATCLAQLGVAMVIKMELTHPGNQGLNDPDNHLLRKIHRDCDDWRNAGARKSGVYTIYPNGTHPVKVHCEHGVNVSYTVILRRLDGRINFYTFWAYYKMGFGSPQGDYWAGLDHIHALTINGNNKLRIDLQDWSGNNRYAQYSKFVVLDESNGYRLSVSGKSGTVPGDDMTFHNGMTFATPDRPDPHQCAPNQRAGWWFNYCSYTLPTGIYYTGGHYPPNPYGFYDGLYWKDWMGYAYSLKFISFSLYK